MTNVADVGDAVELTFTTVPGATVTVTLFDPDQVPVDDPVELTETPTSSGQFPFTFVVTAAGVWTAEFRATGTTAAVERYYVRATTLAGPPPFAAIGDVGAQYGSMTPAEDSLAGWLLRAASNMVRARVPTIDQSIAAGTVSGDLVALAVTNMVLRVLRNPGGLRSETVGPFSRSYDTTVAAGLLVLTDDELSLLSPTGSAARTAVIGEMRPRAALAIVPGRPRGWWGPDGWW
jgi:hypothetical protein